MSGNSDSYLRFSCPQCMHSLRVPRSSAGKQVACPSCRERIVVPANETKGKATLPEEPDRWLQLDHDPSSGPSAQPASHPKSFQPNETQAKETRPGSSLFDDDLPELAPLAPPAAPVPEAGPGAGGLDAALERLGRDESARDDSARDDSARDDSARDDSARDEEFSFPCKVCGTLLYTSMSRVGSMTRCPDCHSEFSVPSRPAKKLAPKIALDSRGPDVRLAPGEGRSPRASTMEKNKAKELLDRAALEADREREELKSIAIPFDSQRWLSLALGCFRDPGVVFIAVVLGAFAAMCFYFLHQFGRMEMPLVQIWILRAFVFALFGVPILVAILMCCMVIIPMAANRLPRVEDWPFGRFGESIGEVGMICVSALIGALPGAFLATLLSWADVHPIIREVLILASIWGLTPFLLLSMIENNRILQPFSKIIFDAVNARPDAWGSMYFQSGLLITGLFVLYCIANMTNAGVTAAFGFVLPFALFFIANQYGILAGRISDITHLGYEGDFSQDNAS